MSQVKIFIITLESLESNILQTLKFYPLNVNIRLLSQYAIKEYFLFVPINWKKKFFKLAIWKLSEMV